MAGFGGIPGVNPILASIIAQPFQLPALRPGEVLQGQVQSVEPKTLIRFGGIVIPVEKVEALLPGQSVSAEVVRTDQGLQLHITPGPLAPPKTPGAESPPESPRDLSGIIVKVLQTLGKLELAEQAVALVPRTVAANAAAVRLVLTMLLDRPGADEHAWRAAQIVQQAVDDGVLSDAEVRDILPALRSIISNELGDIAPALRRAAATAQRPLAARMAEALAKGGVQQFLASLSDEAPAALARLLENDAFVEYLRNAGRSAEFHRAVEHLVDRFAAAQLVNARGADVPYLFFALPTPPDAAVRHAHIHIMGEGGGKAQRFDAKNATVVLDLSTSALGDLWITLTATHGACTCWIRARDAEAVEAIRSQAAGLAARLASAGYVGASVVADLWDGSRVRELATMMRRFKGLNVEA
ncbi:MAG: hypothetical protein HUU46_16975 [Candidatus Hydrogenedentes bacterium]|nr:hypothetical protein [Candidatus Hydrogenedentota bacterium]